MPLEMLAAYETFAAVLDSAFVRPPTLCAIGAAAPTFFGLSSICGIVLPS